MRNYRKYEENNAPMTTLSNQPSTSKAKSVENHITSKPTEFDENNIPIKKTRKIRTKEEIKKDKVTLSFLIYYFY